MTGNKGFTLMHEKTLLAADPSRFSRYAVAAMAALIALAVRLALDPILGEHGPYLPFSLAVIVASRFGGRGPGLAVTGFSLLSVAYFFLEPRHSLRISNPHALAALALFAAVAVLISVFGGQVRDALVSSARTEERLRLAQTDRKSVV